MENLNGGGFARCPGVYSGGGGVLAFHGGQRPVVSQAAGFEPALRRNIGLPPGTARFK